MAETARSLDDTRPITYAAHMEPEDNLGMKYYDVLCLNKYYGWYVNPGDLYNMLPLFSDCLDKFYKAFNKPILVSEFGADAIAGMHSEPIQMFSEEYQAETIVEQYKILSKKEYCIGAHIWAFADFKTAQSISRILLNRKGLFTRDRQPKLAAHKVREMWARTDGRKQV
jgi:beta-glucuronidase